MHRVQQRANRGICFNNVIVLGFLSAMLLWTYLGVPLVYLLDGRAYSSVFLRSAYWLVLLVIFFGGCMAFFGVRSFIDWWNGSTSSSLTQGLRGSLRQRVRREIKAHLRDNRTIRRARYSFFQRAARLLIADRSLPAFLLAYLLLDIVLVGAEVLFNLRFPGAARLGSAGTEKPA